MSAMEWKTLPVDALRPAAYNPRKKLKAGDKEYEKIKNSILEFGYVEPIIVNYDMTVIGGHQRLTVLKDLGYTEVQCVVVHIEDEHKVKALNIALNKITGAWNEELLADLLVDLQSVDFNTDLTGFEAPEIEQLFSKVHNKDIKEDDFDVEEVALFHLVQTGEHQRFNQPAVPGNDRMGGFTSHRQRRAVQVAGTRSQCFLGSAVIKRQIDGLLGHLDCAHHAVAGIKQ